MLEYLCRSPCGERGLKFSALSDGKLFEGSGHTKAYWTASADNRALEIFAELFVLEAQNGPELKIVKAAWPELWEAYNALF